MKRGLTDCLTISPDMFEKVSALAERQHIETPHGQQAAKNFPASIFDNKKDAIDLLQTVFGPLTKQDSFNELVQAFEKSNDNIVVVPLTMASLTLMHAGPVGWTEQHAINKRVDLELVKKFRTSSVLRRFEMMSTYIIDDKRYKLRRIKGSCGLLTKMADSCIHGGDGVQLCH